MTTLVDQWGKPIRHELLTREIAGPDVTGVRSPISGTPADGLGPAQLANILREADMGEPLRYLELAEFTEERDLHYAGVLQARKRSVSQIDVSVESASDDPEDVRRADIVRDWLKRDELSDETFDMLDAVGKQFSITEIVWDFSERQYFPARLEYRDPRWFTFARNDLRTPMLRGGLDGTGQPTPLEPFKFIRTHIKAKSGIPVRSGLARIVAWSYMFKQFTLRDWAIFTQTYGQPIRIGRFHEGASEADKKLLYHAVANIAGDCAAIIPETMKIEFIEAKGVAAGSDLYERRADWLDRQVSKAVLGQTGSTDSKSGGLGDGGNQVHNEVRGDIETADCKALAAAINRDLIRPWMDLEFGPSKKYPRVVIARPDEEDLALLADSLAKLVPLGFRVEQSEVRDKFGLSEPKSGAEVLMPPAASTGGPLAIGRPATPPLLPAPTETTVLQAEQAPPKHPAAQIADAMLDPATDAVADMVETIELMMDRASDMNEFRAMLGAGFPDLDSSKLAQIMAGGLAVANAAGHSDLVEESE